MPLVITFHCIYQLVRTHITHTRPLNCHKTDYFQKTFVWYVWQISLEIWNFRRIFNYLTILKTTLQIKLNSWNYCTPHFISCLKPDLLHYKNTKLSNALELPKQTTYWSMARRCYTCIKTFVMGSAYFSYITTIYFL